MELHHKKHHQAYVTNYNAAIQQYAEVGQLRALMGTLAWSYLGCAQRNPLLLDRRQRVRMTSQR